MKYSVFLVSCIFSTLSFAALQECPPPTPNQRDLFILPDVSQAESIGQNDSLPTELKNLLIYEAAPILVDLSIWKRFIRTLKTTINLTEYFSDMPFEFYHYGSYLLAIPTKWKTQFDNSNTGFNFKNYQRVDPITLQAGILDPIKGISKTYMTVFFNSYTSLVDALSAALLTKNNRGDVYAWNIAIKGHGGRSGTCLQIAGMPFDEFKKLLQFLQHEIKTNILIYSSCYGGGKDLLKVYETNNQQDTFNFPIIVVGITESTTHSTPSLQTPEIYKNFFNTIKTISLCKFNVEKLGLISSTLFQAFVRKFTKYDFLALNNIMQIRWPGTKQFNVIQLKDVIKTSQSLNNSYEVKEKAFIIDAPVTDKNLIFIGEDHQIASSIPSTWHYIKSITLSQKLGTNSDDYIYALFAYFNSIWDLESSKIFLIDKVIVNKSDSQLQMNNVMIFLNSSTPSTYWFQKTKALFYISDNTGFSQTIKKGITGTIQLDPQSTEKYLNLFAQQKKKLLEEYQKNKPVGLKTLLSEPEQKPGIITRSKS